MEINAAITGIHYCADCCTKDLKIISLSDFDINAMPASCVLDGEKFSYAVSKWVSPKRTRSYPYERVYDTLTTSKKCVTIIPVIKDEGANGDRDYLQWDTISLMSLFDVFVILAHYVDAEKNNHKENKITNQQFDNGYVKAKIKEISLFRSSALHWNLKEMEKTLPQLTDNAKDDYAKIGKKLGVDFHGEKGIDRFKEKINEGIEKFKEFSRSKAQEAQNREQQTEQPKEALSTLSKATITINNYLGGEYYLTTDEIRIEKDTLFLIEGKHTKTNNLPSLGDIKDGLLKLILYTNLENVQVSGEKFNTVPVLKLTSEKISGGISSSSAKKEVDDFLSNNSFSDREINIIINLFQEAKKNNFIALIEWATT